jgi:hypothetical protein
MSGLSPDLSYRLRETLNCCGAFDNDRSLRAVFVDARLHPGQDVNSDIIPSRLARIDALIEILTTQVNDTGDLVLALTRPPRSSISTRTALIPSWSTCCFGRCWGMNVWTRSTSQGCSPTDRGQVTRFIHDALQDIANLLAQRHQTVQFVLRGKVDKGQHFEVHQADGTYINLGVRLQQKANDWLSVLLWF